MLKQIIVAAAEPVVLISPVASQQSARNAAVTPSPSVASPKDAGKLVSAEAIANLDPGLASVPGRADRITYRSFSLNGEGIVVSGALLTPKGRAPKGGW